MRVLITLVLGVFLGMASVHHSDAAEADSLLPASEPREVHFFRGGRSLTVANRLASLRGAPEIATMYQRLAVRSPTTNRMLNWGAEPLWIVFCDEQGWALSAYEVNTDFIPRLGVRPYTASGTRDAPVIGLRGPAFVIAPLAMDNFLKAAGIEAKDGQITLAWMKRWEAKAYGPRLLKGPPR